MKRRQLQMDLFATKEATPVLAAGQKKKLLPLIEVLLKEVMAGLPIVTKEGSDDKDCA